MKLPEDFKDLTLYSTFGCLEYEDVISAIIRYLCAPLDEPTSSVTHMLWGEQYKEGPWFKRFCYNDLKGRDGKPIRPGIFGAVCAAGWITNEFTKGVFSLSEDTVKRLIENYETIVFYTERNKPKGKL